MDLSTFQLVDAINDMDMLRNLSDQHGGQHHQQQQQQQYSQQQTHHSANAYNQLHGDIDLLFQSNHNSNNNNSPHINAYLPTSTTAPSTGTVSSYKSNSTGTNRSDQIMSSPHYRTSTQQQQQDCFDQEDILTPLISPAMTPSFNNSYQVQKHHQTMNFSNHGNDMDFSPLSSPAILPQMDRHNNQHRNHRANTAYQDQLTSSSTATSTTDKDNFEAMSANQICEQYEQLEHAKLLITQKLSELQKSQRHHQYDDHNNGYQRSLLSSESTSSKDSNSSLTKNTSMLHMNNNGDHMSIHHHHVLSKPNSPSRSPHMEPATPASLMNMKINNNNTSKLQFSSSGRNQQQKQFYNKSIPTTTNTTTATVPNSHVFQSPIMNTNPMQQDSNGNMILSPMMTPTTTTTHHPAPLSPLALHPRSNTKQRSSTLKEKSTTNSSRYSKKQRRESSEAKISSTNIHASPRALKPLLISPTLNPGIQQPLPSSMLPQASSVRSVEDAERILASKSNYQNLMEGKGAALGIAFSTQIKSGLEVRRTAHKAAEQKRRDSLKEWFDRLRREVEDGYVKRQKTLMSQVIKAQELEKNNNGKQKATTNNNTTDEEMEDMTAVADASAMKPLSKVLLLQYAYEYISSLKETLDEKDKTIEKLLSESNGNEFNNCLKRKNVTKEEEEDEHQDITEESDNCGDL